jgi:soluble lytic murein transglycosylase
MEGILLKLQGKLRYIILFMAILVIIFILLLKHKTLIGYFYPIKYNNIITKYSTEYNLDPYLIFAIINVESHYDPNAKSHKDAQGLMQITPTTGKWAAEKLNIKNFNLDMLYDPDTNIKIGCWFLDNLRNEFHEFDSEVVLMLASYNGGSSNVKKWLKDKKYSQTGMTLDEIPFKETKCYVDKVLRNYKIYKWLYEID